ncbi:YbbR-like domain-containing protein [Parabacteroides sp. OttesenSCG-928-G07]|nr:YbbR-like domain-containing protein [Parabacteroides sp. OttesenSCG-928-G21]MDL2279031.1 YbbR-like domain-containing protein [Parabacteroides sp. OttesenSCG-928-G07]
MSVLEKKHNSFKSGLNKIKAFLQRQSWKETLIFLAFVLLSFGFWLLQSLQQDYEMEVFIPIKYKNIPPDISFIEQAPEQVAVKLRDKGTVLMNYSFGRKFAPIEFNFSNREDFTDQGTITIQAKEIESDILKNLIATTSLISVTPYQIEIKYSKRVNKEVPIIFDGEILLEPGYQLSGEITFNPPVINVYAADAVLDTLKQVSTVFSSFKKTKNTISKTIQIKKIPGVAFETESVVLTIPVEEFTEKTVEIPIQCTDIPEQFTVRLLPHTVKVSCNIPMSRFRDLTADQFAITIPFEELEDNISGVMSIELTEKPEWIRSATLSPNKIEFIIEQNRREE